MATEVEKVSDPGNLVPRNFFGSRRKFRRKFLRFEINCKNNSVTLAIGSKFLQRISQKFLKSDN